MGPTGRDGAATGLSGPAIRGAREGDLAGILDLLRRAGLPTAGVAEHVGTFWVAEVSGVAGGALRETGAVRLVGVSGLELYPPYALLRSVAVAPDWQGRGLGRRLTGRALGEAAGRNCREAFLLTTTAEAYFTRLGFERRARESLPRELEASAELKGACPVTAAAMGRGLENLP